MVACHELSPETSVNVTNNSPSRDCSHPDDQTTQATETPGFKPFTKENLVIASWHAKKKMRGKMAAEGS